MKKQEIKTIMGSNIYKFIEVDITKLNMILEGKAKILTRREEYEKYNSNNSSICIDILEDSNKSFDAILQEVMNVNKIYQTENKRNMIQIVFD